MLPTECLVLKRLCLQAPILLLDGNMHDLQSSVSIADIDTVNTDQKKSAEQNQC